MEPTLQEKQLGTIASSALLFPMAPQFMSEAELEALAGAHFGWDLLGGHLYPEMAAGTARFGGSKTDAALRAKLQSWVAGWVEPPDRYLVHHPVYASGQWWRIFRTTMFVERDLAEAHEAARTLSVEDMEARYAHILGAAARERLESHEGWWANVLTVLRMGTWHLAIYSPKHQAFVSPFILDEAEQPRPIETLRAEWPRPVFRFYPTNESADLAAGIFDLARMIQGGALIEVLGHRHAAPPFGEAWGEGVVLTLEGGNNGAVVAGLIHAFQDETGLPQRRVTLVSEVAGKEAVSLDGPDAFRLVQAIYAVTGMAPHGVPAELMAPERLGDLVATYKDQIVGTEGDSAFSIPKGVFEAAIALHPGLTPVYGRVASLI